MIKFILLLIPQFAMALTLNPAPFPIFLRAGFSTVLEFEDTPTKVVLGDSQSFQVEKLDHSLVVKTRASYATSNMFVYFKTKEPKLFILTASEENEPTYYKKFELLVPPKPIIQNTQALSLKREMKLISAQFTPKKDFLTVEIEVSADSKSKIIPQWDKVRLSHNKNTIAPYKLWAERKEIQKDSRTKARFIFNKPNLGQKLNDVKLIVPVAGSKALTVNLSGRLR